MIPPSKNWPTKWHHMRYKHAEKEQCLHILFIVRIAVISSESERSYWRKYKVCVQLSVLKSPLPLRLHAELRKHVEQQLQNEGQEGSKSEAILCQRIDSLSQVSVHHFLFVTCCLTPYVGTRQLRWVVQTDYGRVGSCSQKWQRHC